VIIASHCHIRRYGLLSRRIFIEAIAENLRSRIWLRELRRVVFRRGYYCWGAWIAVCICEDEQEGSWLTNLLRKGWRGTKGCCGWGFWSRQVAVAWRLLGRWGRRGVLLPGWWQSLRMVCLLQWRSLRLIRLIWLRLTDYEVLIEKALKIRTLLKRTWLFWGLLRIVFRIKDLFFD